MKRLNRWIYAGAGVCVLLFAGVIYAWSIFSVSIGSEFPDWSKAQLSMTFTAAMIFFCIGGLLGGFLVGKINVKINVAASGVLFLAGFEFASRAAVPWQLCVGFGVMAGLASGLAYNAVLGTMSKWFPDKQGLIFGILLMGFGIGSFLIGKAYQVYTPGAPGSWRASFRFLGMFLFAVLAVGSFFFEKPSGGATGVKSPNVQGGEDLPPRQVLKNPAFWFSYAWAVLTGAAGLVLVSQASGILTEAAPLTESGFAAVVVGLISVFNGTGRVVFGFLYDRKGYRFAMAFDILLSLSAAALLLLAISEKLLPLLILGFAVGGLAFGGSPTSVSALTSDFFGMKYYPVNYSIICTNLIFASFGSIAAGYLYDLGGSYVYAMFMVIGMTVLSGICMLKIRRPEKRAA
jgi:OFA family oxalate/formate antiporter-like MFS transporter